MSDIKPNPLLIPNAVQDNSLCAFSMKKSSRNYHHKTITDWPITSSNDYSRLKKMKKNDWERKEIIKFLVTQLIIFKSLKFQEWSLVYFQGFNIFTCWKRLVKKLQKLLIKRFLMRVGVLFPTCNKLVILKTKNN